MRTPEELEQLAKDVIALNTPDEPLGKLAMSDIKDKRLLRCFDKFSLEDDWVRSPKTIDNDYSDLVDAVSQGYVTDLNKRTHAKHGVCFVQSYLLNTKGRLYLRKSRRTQRSKERRAGIIEIETEHDDLINGGEVVFDDQIYDIYEQDVYPPYPHI